MNRCVLCIAIYMTSSPPPSLGDVLSRLRGLLSTTAEDLRGFRQLFIIIAVTAFLSVLTGLGLHDGPVRRRSEGR